MTDVSTARTGMSTRTKVRIGAAVVCLVLLVVFVVENNRTVPIRFLFWEVHTRLAWALVVSGAAGFLVGVALPRLRRLLRR